MEEQGLWDLFFETGLPEVYLALCAQRMEWDSEERKTAFVPVKAEKRKI